MFKKKDNKNKNNIYQDNTIKQIAFFGFYLVFFVVVIILLRTSYKSTSKKETNKLSGYGYDYKLISLNNNNYHFAYKENKNDIQTIYEGDKLNNIIKFVKSGDNALNYYSTGDKFYVKDNNLLTWSETTNPMIFNDFIKVDNIQGMISRAKYVYKTQYIDDNSLYFGYTITNDRINKIIHFEQTKSEDRPSDEDKKDETKEIDERENTILVYTDKKGNIKTINFDLTNYYKSINPEINKYTLNINYSSINEIKEITNPIN